MKNLKEVHPLLTAIFCLNRTGNEDRDISLILSYAFETLYGSNTNLLYLICVGQTRESMKEYVFDLLKQDTNFKKYLEEIRK